MAIFHLHVKNISRGDGRSVVAAAAYRAGQTLPNEIEERDSAFGGRRDVLHAEIRLPAGAPDWMADRAALWNAVERAEVRKDARLAKEIEVALPRELPRSQWLVLVREFADVYVLRGFVVDVAIHDDGTLHNPHAHLLLTTRTIEGDRFGSKVREADGKAFVMEARRLWAALTNTTFAKGGSTLVIDHRSHEETGTKRQPARHRGPDRAERQARRRAMPDIDRKALRAELGTTGAQAGEDTEMRGVWGQEHWPVAEVPVPGPENDLLSRQDLDRAQTAMLEEMEAETAGSPAWFRETVKTEKPADRKPEKHWFSRKQGVEDMRDVEESRYERTRDRD